MTTLQIDTKARRGRKTFALIQTTTYCGHMSIEDKAYWGAVSTVIRMQMMAHDLTQAKLAKAVGVSRDAMGNYLRGDRDMPFTTLAKVSDALGLTPYSLFGLAEDLMKQGKQSGEDRA